MMVTNEEVFNMANTKHTLLDGLLKRRLAFHGHLVRKGGITLDLMIGRLHVTRRRPRTTWLKDLATQAKINYAEAITIPRDRKKWRSVGNPRRMPDEREREEYLRYIFYSSKPAHSNDNNTSDTNSTTDWLFTASQYAFPVFIT